MVKPKILVLTGYGINCDEETQFAFNKAGGLAERVHVNDLIDGHRKLIDYQILSIPGGFSYGDDTGAGNALANRIKNHLWYDVKNFVNKDRLAIGICNGFQVMANLGLVPAVNTDYGISQVALIPNDIPRYSNRWVDLQFDNVSIWTKGLGIISLPIAHGEGKFYANEKTLDLLKKNKLIAARYVKGEMCEYEQSNPNPNGSLDDIAAVSYESGRVIGMMPHPERAINFTQLPNWTYLREVYGRRREKIPEEASGLQIFRNGVKYFK